LNPGAEIIPVFATVTENNVSQFLTGAQVVLDGLDNFSTRLIVNSACVRHKIPFIHGGVARFRGLLTTILPGETACLACLYPEGSPGGEGLGVLGSIPAVIANLQALEAIKLLIGQGASLAGKVLRFNGNDMKFQINEIQRNVNCRVCSSIVN
jgi:molybdopterin/thiamine biosynthesis adenylyltransferase